MNKKKIAGMFFGTLGIMSGIREFRDARREFKDAFSANDGIDGIPEDEVEDILNSTPQANEDNESTDEETEA